MPQKVNFTDWLQNSEIFDDEWSKKINQKLKNMSIEELRNMSPDVISILGWQVLDIVKNAWGFDKFEDVLKNNRAYMAVFQMYAKMMWKYDWKIDGEWNKNISWAFLALKYDLKLMDTRRKFDKNISSVGENLKLRDKSDIHKKFRWFKHWEYWNTFQTYISMYKYDAGEYLENFVGRDMSEQNFKNFVWSDFSMWKLYVYGAYEKIMRNQTAKGYDRAIFYLNHSLDELKSFKIEEYKDQAWSLMDMVVDKITNGETYQEKIGREYKNGAQFSLFQRMMKSWILKNLSFCQVELAKIKLKKCISEYKKIKDDNVFMRKLEGVTSLLSKATWNSQNGKILFTHKLSSGKEVRIWETETPQSQKLTNTVDNENKKVNKIPWQLVDAQIWDNVPILFGKDIKPQLWGDKWVIIGVSDDMMWQIANIQQIVTNFTSQIEQIQSQQELVSISTQSEWLMQWVDNILEKFAGKRLGSLLSKKDRQLLTRLFWKDFLIPEKNWEGLDFVKWEEDRLKKMMGKIGSALVIQKQKVDEKQTQIDQIEGTNGELQKKREELRWLQSEENYKYQQILKSRLEKLRNWGDRKDGLWVRQKFSWEAEWDWMYKWKVDTFSNVDGYKSDLSFGFDDKISGHERTDFDIYPPVNTNYFPWEVLSDFDKKTSKWNMWQVRKKTDYFNRDIVATNTYLSKTNQCVTKLSLPQDYTVNTESLHLSKDIKYNILKDQYSFVYLVLDNPDWEEIEFGIGIGLDTTVDDNYVPKDQNDRLYDPLFEGPYSQTTQKELFESIGIWK